MAEGRTIAENWIAAIVTETGYEVHRPPAPEDTPYPHVTVGIRAGNDIKAQGSPSNVQRLVYDVSVWTTGSDDREIREIAAEIKARMDSVPPVTTPDGVILSCKRNGIVPVGSFVENGENYIREGYLYDITTLST